MAGGVAVIAHGYGRLTQDVDLIVRLDAESVRRAFDALGGLGYRPLVPVTAEGFVVFVTEPFDFAEEHRLALVEELAPGVPVRIVRLAALLRMKRAAGRPQDLAELARFFAQRREARGQPVSDGGPGSDDRLSHP